MKRITTALICAPLLMIATTAPALAQSAAPEASVSATATAGSLDNTLTAFGILGYWYSDTGFGVGARYQKTLIPGGFLKLSNVPDDFGLEAGADFYHYSFDAASYGWTYNEISLVVGAVWNFWFLDGRLALYPKVDFGYRFGSWSTNSGISNPSGYGGLAFQGSAGIVYKVGKLALRAEAGSGSLRLGVGFTL